MIIREHRFNLSSHGWLLWGILFILLISAAIFLPAAFRLGVSHGSAYDSAQYFGAEETDLFNEALYATRRLSSADCFDLGHAADIGRPGIHIDCQPPQEAQGLDAPIFAAREPRAKQNPILAQAAAAAIATRNRGVLTEPEPVSNPDNPVAAAVMTTGETGGQGGGASGFSLFPSGGAPLIQVPNLFPGQPAAPGGGSGTGSGGGKPIFAGDPADNGGGVNPDNPFDDPVSNPAPDLVTPVPPGIALMLTGLIGFFSAVRYR